MLRCTSEFSNVAYIPLVMSDTAYMYDITMVTNELAIAVTFMSYPATPFPRTCASDQLHPGPSLGYPD